ncbi:MAG: Uma2 family endonuclease [Chloroflexi bacterium]|nr:Uma2 family endonuclease [Chloroflexota bacterium]
MTIAEKRLTLAEFLALPERKPALRYLPDGTITQKVSPKTKHGIIQGALVTRVNRFAEPGRVARAIPEIRCTFGGASHVPDVGVFRWERIPRDPDGRVADNILIPPDLAVEIVSPGQSTTGLVELCLWYVANGVRLALVLDPADESALVVQPDRTVRVLRGEDVFEAGEALPGFALGIGELFQTLRLD